ncbi:polysaccharide biosynthesis C-terminal domain-containing protein [Haloprofundus salilacus]|uniref:oligosaccharide flippase family protein n=1 Tax=Haloprofundus salilacus TaxID=2876190 RepID=UPI001CCB030B|nr:polysaccharide biosynthesis C-terminal domain-containing protein [Haloprofundus salilacus]
MSSRTVSGIISVLGGKFGATFLTAAITPLLVRVLGGELYGQYAFLLSAFAVITVITRSGISAGIRKYIAEDRPGQDWDTHVFAFYTRLAVGIAVLVGVCLLLFGVYKPLNSLLSPAFEVYFALLAAMVVTDQLFYVTRYTLMGLHYERYSEPLSVLQTLLYGVLGLSLAYIGFDVVGVLAGTAISSFVCAVVATWLLRTRIDLMAVFRPLPRNFPRRNLLSFNAFNTVFILLTISLYNTDILLLQPLVGSQQTGFYKAALVVAEFLWLVPQAIQIVFIHSSSKLWSQQSYDEISAMASRATRYTLVFTTLLLIGLAALAEEFMQLYFGTEFDAAVTPLLLLLPGVLGFALARPIFAIGQGKGDLRVLIFATGTAAIINLVLNLSLIPRYGMAGAAIATSVGYGSMIIFHGAVARRIGYNPFGDLRLLSFTVTAGLSAVAIVGLATMIESTFVSLVVVPPVGFVIYATLALRTRVIDADEAISLLEQAPAPLSGWSITAVRHLT